jgi:hypothetical protein
MQPLGSKLKEAGLTESQVQVDLELKLRLAGKKELNKVQWLKEKGVPFIYISLFNLKPDSQGWFIYSINCGLRQNVFLERDPFIKIGSSTWSIDYLGIGEIKSIREATKELVDQFINDYLSVNPKK